MIDGAACYRCFMLGWEDGASGNLMDAILALKAGEPGHAYREGYELGSTRRAGASTAAQQLYTPERLR